MVAAQTRSPARMLMFLEAPQPKGYKKPKGKRKGNVMEAFTMLRLVPPKTTSPTETLDNPIESH